jgi:hypothetical protein
MELASCWLGAPHIPVWERYQRTDGMFPRTDFAYDAERDVYICPNDRILKTSGTVMMVVSGTIYHTALAVRYHF